MSIPKSTLDKLQKLGYLALQPGGTHIKGPECLTVISTNTRLHLLERVHKEDVPLYLATGSIPGIPDLPVIPTDASARANTTTKQLLLHIMEGELP